MAKGSYPDDHMIWRSGEREFSPVQVEATLVDGKWTTTGALRVVLDIPYEYKAESDSLRDVLGKLVNVSFARAQV